MKSKKFFWKEISKKQKVQVVIAASLTLLLTVQLPVMAWFQKQREAARFERINAPNTLFITAAHREDSKNLVMDDITVDGKWIVNGEEVEMSYQDYVFAVAGDYVENFTLQLAHTTNNPYTYEIFEADPTIGAPKTGEVIGRDYVVYKVTDIRPSELPEIADNVGTKIETEGGEKVIYYRVKKTEMTVEGENGTSSTISKAVTLNQESDLKEGETNKCSYSENGSVTYDGQYLNMGNDGKADNTFNNLTYSSYSHYDQRVQPLYWQCTNIPGSSGVSKNSFYREYILRVYFNSTSTTYKDTDVVYITAIGNN
ncbi:MAG: hypothetical protein IKI37_06255 [Oscillospiraceae bacterium]|nr:hypothetical protein [Oscillospiraceae bacterium]